jgi:charged multivesicular body protein 2A
MMEFFFGRRKTPEEILRENKRAIDRAIRELEREKGRMEQQEVKLTNEIRKSARNNEMDSIKIMAKDLVRTKGQIKKFNIMKANLQAISLKTATLKSQNSMAQAMRGVTQGLIRMNRQMNLPQIQRIIQEFQKQTDMVDMKEEMINDVMDDVFEEDTDEQESDQVVNKVLDELGIEMNQTLATLPSSGKQTIADKEATSADKLPAPAQTVVGGSTAVDADLEERLNKLRRD